MPTTHLFISYVREDADKVDRICETLQAANVNIWLDRDSIAPGLHWQDSIRHAIAQGSYFMACFSANYWSRTRSVMNTELGLAMKELATRRRDVVWFIPVRLDDCLVPEWPIGAGETLGDLQYVDLFRDWPRGMSRIMAVMSPFSSVEYREHAREYIAEEFRTGRALQLYDDWHSPLMHSSRINVSSMLALIERGLLPLLPPLSDFEASQTFPTAFTQYADDVFRVIHFFERWATLRTERLLDHGLCRRLLGSYIAWYQPRFLAPLMTHETNADYIRTLASVQSMVYLGENSVSMPKSAPERHSDVAPPQ